MHLVVIMIAASIGMNGLVLFHIITHRFVKASAFVASGVVIGALRGQDLRSWGFSIERMVIILAFVILCGVGRSLISNSKEMVVLDIMGMFVVCIG